MKEYRPFKYWLPELLNRLRFPDFIMRQARRDEVAALLKQARKDGVPLMDTSCGFYQLLTKVVLARAPKKKRAYSSLLIFLEQAKKQP